MPLATIDELMAVVDAQEWSPFPSEDEVALGRALVLADAAQRSSDGSWIDDDAWDASRLSDDDLVDSLTGPAHEMHLPLLASIDPRTLSHELTRVTYLQALDRVAGLVASLRSDAIVALAGESAADAAMSELHVEHEISVARRVSRYGAGKAIETARALATTFPAFGAALRAGEVSETHCVVLVDRTRAVADPEVLTAIEARVLSKAKRLTPGEFGREVAKAVAALDADAVARVERATSRRAVWSRQIEDGMGYLGLVHDWSTVKAIHEAVTADALALRLARRESGTGQADADGASASGVVGRDGVASVGTGPEPDADPAWQDSSLDACRADAMAARILGTVDAEGAVTWDRSDVQVVVNVVMDLDTLRGEADRAAELDGQPIPAANAQQAAAWARAWRRLVTDPVDGHLLDYGTATYLPSRLRDYVLARDATCRAPGCTNRAATRLQMDHAVEFPVGSSSAENCGALCTSCHQLKTARLVDIVDSGADGSAVWTTGWGQVVRIPARPVLEHPAERATTPMPTASGLCVRPDAAGPPDVPPF